MTPFIQLLILSLLLGGCVSQNISGSYFNCEPLEAGRPAESVHQLRPTDIRVIGALGDSLTAALNAIGNITLRIEHRGLSFSGGGDGNISYVTTLPNILKEYSPDLYGYANGTTQFIPRSMEYVDLPNVRLNLGLTAAFTFQLLEQAQAIVRKLTANTDVDFDNDWKLITIFIGYNDPCSLPCRNDPRGDPDVWISNITTTLDYLKENLPRTFINFIQLANVPELMEEVVSISEGCRGSYAAICPCGSFGALSIENISQYFLDYRMELQNLIDSGRYDTSDDFTVVLQPFLSELSTDENGDVDIDLSVLAPDCNHYSSVGNRIVATGLWNNMFEPVGRKSTKLNSDVRIVCPTNEQPFFATAMNSENSRAEETVTRITLSTALLVGGLVAMVLKLLSQ